MPDERSASADVQEQLIDTIERLARELDPARAARATPAASIERDLGIDSLARVELLLRIERHFGVHLPERTLAEAETVADLLAALRAELQAATADVSSSAGSAPTATSALPGGSAPPLSERVQAERRRRIDSQADLPTADGTPHEAETLIGVLAWHVARHADRDHIHLLGDGDQVHTLTYGGLYEAAKRVAAALQPHGVSGAPVALMLPTGLEFFTSFLGVQLAGAIPVPLYPPARPSQLEDHMRRHATILANCGARALITVPAVKPLARLIQPGLPLLAAVLTADELAAGAPSAAFVRSRPADLALLQYTSGSTGNPKGVMLSHTNVMANIRAWSERTGLSSADVCVSWLPLYHDMGLIGTWMGSLYNACPLVLMSPLAFLARPERWLWAIHTYRGTVTAAPNFAFELLLRRYDAQSLAGLDLSSWRLCANGAEPVSADTIEHFAQRFAAHGFSPLAMAPVYGLAENAVGLTVPPPGRGPRIDRVARADFQRNGRAEPAPADDPQPLRFAVCGPPLPRHEVRIVDERGHALPERRVGRIEFRGPSATAGYFRNPEATAALLRDGWLDTGDLGYRVDGELVITSRIKDVIIRGGHNLYPYELEEAVGQLPGIRKGCVAVFGSHDPLAATERLVMVAETRLTDPADRQALTQMIRQRAMELLGTPIDEVVLASPNSVLKTSSGKIRRAATREAWETGQLGRSARPAWLQVARLGAAAAGQRLRRALDETVHTLYALYAWSVFVLLAAAMLVALLVTKPGAPSWRVCRLTMRALLAAAGVRLQVQGIEHVGAAGPRVLVANHASFLDGLILAAVLAQPVVFVAKRELLASRLIRFALGRLNTRYVERFEVRDSVADAQRLSEAARAGERLCIFAEGTFVREPGLRPFRLGAFAAAADSGAAVVPIALRGTRTLWPAGTWRPRRAAVSVTIGAPIEPTGEGWEAAVRLRDDARAFIVQHCGEPELPAAG